MKKPLVTAHAGCNNTPLNTTASVLSGVEWGADIIEIDVRATKDGVPILWHNDDFQTINNDLIQVKNITYREIKTLEDRGEIKFSHSDIVITSLEDVFEVTKNMKILLNLDLKDDECIVPVARLVKERSLVEGVIFSGCEEVRASYLKDNYPEFQVLLNARERIADSNDLSYSEKVKKLCNTAVVTGCCGLNISHDFCSPELVDCADRRFLPVVVWTVSPESGFEKFIEMGVYSINTLHVKELVEINKNRYSS